MFLKKVTTIGSTLVLSLASLTFMTINSPVVHAAGVTLYWCNENASTADFNTASNWNTDSDCSSGTAEVPVTGDTLVFDNTNLASGIVITNDISGLDINSITFQGTNTNSYGFEIEGDAMSLDNGVVESSTGLDEINVDLMLTASQTITDTSGDNFGLDFGDTSLSQTLNLGSNTLTLDSDIDNGGVINFNDIISGTGSIIANGTADGVYESSAPSPNFSGNVELDIGQIYTYNEQALGTGNITVDNGASLSGIFSGTSNDLSNPITVGGTGYNGEGAIVFDDDCPGGGGQCANDGTVTLSGPMILTADTSVGADTTVDVTGNVSGGYCLSPLSGSSGSLEGNDGTCTSTTIAASTPGTNAPKTPDTGSSLSSANVILPLLGGITAAAGLYIYSKKAKYTTSK